MKIKLIYATLLLLVLSVAPALSQTRVRPYRGSFQSVRQTILNIENRTGVFRDDSQRSLNRRGTTVGRAEDPFLFVSDFAEWVRRLHERFDRRVSTMSDVQEVLNRATRIDDFMRRNALDATAQGDWSSMR